jgi:hypothetical protein
MRDVVQWDARVALRLRECSGPPETVFRTISTPAGLLEDEENCWVSMESITSDSVKVHDYLCPVKSARVW